MASDIPAVDNSGVVFLHIPKTTGMTFRDILISRYGAQFHFCDDPTLAGIEAALTDYRCVELHTLTTPTDWYIIHAELVRQNRLDLLEGTRLVTRRLPRCRAAQGRLNALSGQQRGLEYLRDHAQIPISPITGTTKSC